MEAVVISRNFKKNGYCLVRNAVHPELRDVITQYALFDEMQDFTPDTVQVPKAHSKYADPAMEAMLLHLHGKVEKCTGLKLHPTYSFYRVYRNGDELLAHTDRPSCEISATVCFNYSYSSIDEYGYTEHGGIHDGETYAWPIFMNGTPVVMNRGDMVIYRGMEVPHWREEFSPPGDHWHVQAFFHYVEIAGPNDSYKWDNRSSIGTLKTDCKKQVNKSYITYL